MPLSFFDPVDLYDCLLIRVDGESDLVSGIEPLKEMGWLDGIAMIMAATNPEISLWCTTI